MKSSLRITDLGASRRGAVNRVAASVDGLPLWFETADVPLTASPEAFATALLMPAAARRQRLAMDTPVCRHWAVHAEQAGSVMDRWWGYRLLAPAVQTIEQGRPRRADGVGLCFTGGVDSFFTLLRGDQRPTHFVYAIDFDVPPDAPQRRSTFEPDLRLIAAQYGAQAVVVRSNLREHPSFSHVSWKQTHGAALAAVGHLLSGSIGALVISSSYPYADSHPWGSHWMLDPLWSSSQLEIIHSGATHWRADKLREIAHEPLVRHHLRPCWENPPGRLNCAQCEKCIRTQLLLATCGPLSTFTAFEHELPLARRIDRLRKIPNASLHMVYEDLVRAGLEPDVEQAVRKLLIRSRRSVRRKQWKARLRKLIPFFAGSHAPAQVPA